jgi:hypothetical protein
MNDPDSPDAIDCEIPQSLVDKFAEGPIDPPLPVVVSPASGSWEVVNVPGRTMTNQSRDYSPGDSGWAFGPTTAQLPNANVTGSLGADAVTANTISLGGQDLAGEVLDPMPVGMTANYVVGDSVSGVNTAQVTDETILFLFNAGPMKAGRRYQVGYHANTSSAVSPSDTYRTQLRYTLDSTVPTLSSPALDRSALLQPGTAATGGSTFLNVFSMSVPADADTVMFALTGARVQGTTGTFQIRCTSEATGLQMWVSDLGSAAGIGGSGAQVSKITGTPDPPPTGRYTQTWTSTARANYDLATGGQFYVGNNDCVQGDNHGSLIFDEASIQAALAGATINSVTLRFRDSTAYQSAGLDVRVSSHNFTAIPASWGVGGQITSRDDSAAGSTYTIALPTTFGDDLRDDNAAGIAFVAPTTALRYSGNIYGPASKSPPALTVSYTK